MKAVILARGLGSRMREDGDAPLTPAQAAAAATGAKAMMPIAATGPARERPLLDYSLSRLADAGCTSACLVIGPEHAAIRRYYTEIAPPRRLALAFAEQALPRGTADAVAAAAGYIGSDDVLVLNGDNLYPLSAQSALCRLRGPGTALFRASALIAKGNVAAERVRAFAIAAIDAGGHLAAIIEKPSPAELAAAGADPLVSMNCWRMPPQIVDACRAVAPSPRGELELTHAVTYAIETLGVRFETLVCDDGVLDLSRRGDISTVAAHLSSVVPRP